MKMTGLKQPTEKTKIKGLIKAASNVLSVFLLILILILAFFSLHSRYTGVPTLAGYHLYKVMSGSMSPTFDTGSMVIVKPQAPSQINVGDIITFKQSGAEVTHRVVGVNTQNGLQFITQGDANETFDLEPVPAESVVGKVVLAIPYAGYVTDFAKSTTGLITLFILPGILIIISEVRNLIGYIGELENAKG